MNQLLPQFNTSANIGLEWPMWVAAFGFFMFCLLGTYAAISLFAGNWLPPRIRLVRLPTIRSRLIVGFILVATLPAISLALMLSERTIEERLDRTGVALKSQAVTTAQFADYFLETLTKNLTAIATQLQPDFGANADIVSRRLVVFHDSNPGFKTIMLLDLDGRVGPASRSVDRQAETFELPGESFADREYFRNVIDTGDVFLSDALNDPLLDQATVAVVSAPLIDAQGKLSGVLMGVYDPRNFVHLQTYFGFQSGINAIMLDRNGHLLFASDPVDNHTDTSLLSTPDTGDGTVFTFTHPDRAGSDQRSLAMSQPLQNGWRVFLYRSISEIEATLLNEYLVTLTWLVGSLIISICLALALVRAISGPLEDLDQSVREFNLQSNQQRDTPPADAPQEVLAIFEHLASLEKRLRVNYRKLRKALKQGEKLRGELIYVIANREKEIVTRTEELREANRSLKRLSREDSLTGLANRRWLAQFLTRTWQGAIRQKQAISIMLIDIDDFKAFNDNYGHQKGDACLKVVAATILRAVGRASDLVSRYGGEEFIVVLGDTSLDGALLIAEKIRVAVETLNIKHKGAKFHDCVTVSIGVTSTLPTAELQPETVLVSADRAMYTAKHDGKNRVAYSTAARTGTYQALCLPNNSASNPS
jgi:diguanylate cyclase (GGDEF)-like protein